jgi:hypothetical protein
MVHEIRPGWAIPSDRDVEELRQWVAQQGLGNVEKLNMLDEVCRDGTPTKHAAIELVSQLDWGEFDSNGMALIHNLTLDIVRRGWESKYGLIALCCRKRTHFSAAHLDSLVTLCNTSADQGWQTKRACLAVLPYLLAHKQQLRLWRYTCVLSTAAGLAAVALVLWVFVLPSLAQDARKGCTDLLCVANDDWQTAELSALSATQHYDYERVMNDTLHHSMSDMSRASALCDSWIDGVNSEITDEKTHTGSPLYDPDKLKVLAIDAWPAHFRNHTGFELAVDEHGDARSTDQHTQKQFDAFQVSAHKWKQQEERYLAAHSAASTIADDTSRAVEMRLATTAITHFYGMMDSDFKQEKKQHDARLGKLEHTRQVLVLKHGHAKEKIALMHHNAKDLLKTQQQCTSELQQRDIDFLGKIAVADRDERMERARQEIAANRDMLEVAITWDGQKLNSKQGQEKQRWKHEATAQQRELDNKLEHARIDARIAEAAAIANRKRRTGRLVANVLWLVLCVCVSGTFHIKACLDPPRRLPPRPRGFWARICDIPASAVRWVLESIARWVVDSILGHFGINHLAAETALRVSSAVIACSVFLNMFFAGVIAVVFAVLVHMSDYLTTRLGTAQGIDYLTPIWFIFSLAISLAFGQLLAAATAVFLGYFLGAEDEVRRHWTKWIVPKLWLGVLCLLAAVAQYYAYSL